MPPWTQHYLGLASSAAQNSSYIAENSSYVAQNTFNSTCGSLDEITRERFVYWTIVIMMGMLLLWATFSIILYVYLCWDNYILHKDALYLGKGKVLTLSYLAHLDEKEQPIAIRQMIQMLEPELQDYVKKRVEKMKIRRAKTSLSEFSLNSSGGDWKDSCPFDDGYEEALREEGKMFRETAKWEKKENQIILFRVPHMMEGWMVHVHNEMLFCPMKPDPMDPDCGECFPCPCWGDTVTLRKTLVYGKGELDNRVIRWSNRPSEK